MVRIFFALGLLSTGLLITNIVVGFWVGDWNGLTREFLEQSQEVQDLEKSSSTVAAERLKTLRPAFAQTSERYEMIRARQALHFLLGVLAALVAVLINSISVTYFIGTSRWCLEVAETYELKMGVVERSRRLKRRTFSWAMISITLILILAMLGAMSDPSTGRDGSVDSVPWHRYFAIITTGFIGWSYLIQVGAIGANFEIIEDILKEVKTIRAQRGLDPAE